MPPNALTFNELRVAMPKKNRPFHLLLGNGFSMSYDAGMFSYNALHSFVESTGDDLLPKIFQIVGSNNFELVMKQLENFERFVDIFGISPDVKVEIQRARSELKRRLIDAIGELHPEHVFKIPEERNQACAKFLKTFLDSNGSIFTTNYDLLLYWVLMRNAPLRAIACDGFGRDRENLEEWVPDEELEYSQELRWGRNASDIRVYYVHGALPLFDNGTEVVKEVYSDGSYLLTNIRDRINRNEYPIFVTAGDGAEKLKRIRQNPYLNHAYQALTTIEGSLVSFGFNFGEYDGHVVDAINRAASFDKSRTGKLWSLYVGVYSEADRSHIESIRTQIKCKVNLFDSRTVDVWGRNEGFS